MDKINALWWWCFRKLKAVYAAIAFAVPRRMTKPNGGCHKIGRTFLRIIAAMSMLLFMSPVFTHFGGSSSGLPLFTYTGTYTLIDDNNGNWRIKFLTSGTLRVQQTMTIDVFLVGGGAGGGTGSGNGWGGGAGGYTMTQRSIGLLANTDYAIVVGAGGAAAANGGSTAALGFSVLGGSANGTGGCGGGVGTAWDGYNASAGGSDGSGGAAVYSNPATSGQGSTTREFGEVSGALYAGGGGGGAYGTIARGGAGGAGGGGTGSNASGSPSAGTANTGGGGGGSASNGWGAAGGSGIVIIRNMRAA